MTPVVIIIVSALLLQMVLNAALTMKLIELVIHLTAETVDGEQMATIVNPVETYNESSGNNEALIVDPVNPLDAIDLSHEKV